MDCDPKGVHGIPKDLDDVYGTPPREEDILLEEGDPNREYKVGKYAPVYHRTRKSCETTWSWYDFNLRYEWFWMKRDMEPLTVSNKWIEDEDLFIRLADQFNEWCRING